MTSKNLGLSSRQNEVIVPVFVCIVFSVMVAAMWMSFDRQRDANLREALKFEAELRASLIDGDIRTRLLALKRIVDRWEVRGGTPKIEFLTDLDAYIRDFPGFQALGWVDSKFYVRWITPVKGNEEAVNLYLAFEKERRRSLELMRKNRIPVMTTPIDLVQGGKGFLIYFPIFIGNQFDGLLSAVIRIESWLDFVLHSQDYSSNFRTTVDIEGRRVYEHKHEPEQPFTGWKVETKTVMMGHQVSVGLAPTQAFFIANRSYLPEWAAAIGLMLTALATYLSRTTFVLRIVIVERWRAEEALRAAHENLEETVEQRTAELNEQIRERKHLEKKLLGSQRMEAVGQLTGGIAHDFNNLMGVMIGNAELLKDKIAKDKKGEHHINAIIKAVEQGASLTQRLLAFSRQQPLSSRPTEINSLVHDLKDMLRRTLGETVELCMNLDPETGRALIDPHPFESALVNLAINARDAMPNSGTLTITTTNTILDETYAEPYEELIPGSYVEITVSDTGTGISPEILENVFEPFFTTKGVGEGSGLGLSMVYGFAKQSNGHVTISSEVGQGTTVQLFMPRTHESKIQEIPQNGLPEPALRSERVLIVEDDPGIREISAGILRGQGYDVVDVIDGKQAIEYLKGDTAVDLLFTDVILPGGMNGAEIARQAHQIQPNIKVLFTTGYSEDAIVHDGKLDPGVILIKKPYRRAELLELVTGLLSSGKD